MNKTIEQGSQVIVSLPRGGTILGDVEEFALDKVWVRLENGNPRLCNPSDLTLRQWHEA